MEADFINSPNIFVSNPIYLLKAGASVSLRSYISRAMLAFILSFRKRLVNLALNLNQIFDV
jgi:hypothetical protein